VRRLLGFLLVLPLALAAPAAAQMVTDVPATDTLQIENVGVVKLLGVEGSSSRSASAKEVRCAAEGQLFVSQLARAKVVRLAKDVKVANRAELASDYYVYLPDGRLLNKLVLETGCARPMVYISDLTLAQPLENAATSAQMANRGVYGLDDYARSYVPTRPREVYQPPPPKDLYPRVTLSTFNRVAIGAKYSEVVRILGSRGEEVSSTETARYKRRVVEWKGADGGYASIEFVDGVVESKTQRRLQ
jgi:endonuclease YncB( thermonuclease family)